MRVISANEMVSVEVGNGDLVIIDASDIRHVRYHVKFFPFGSNEAFILGSYGDVDFCKKLIKQLTILNGFKDVIYVSMPEDEGGKQLKVSTFYEEMPVDVFLNIKEKQFSRGI